MKEKEQKEREILISITCDLVNQGAMHYNDGTFGDGALSTYASAIEYLITLGKIVEVYHSKYSSGCRYKWVTS